MQMFQFSGITVIQVYQWCILLFSFSNVLTDFDDFSKWSELVFRGSDPLSTSASNAANSRHLKSTRSARKIFNSQHNSNKSDWLDEFRQTKTNNSSTVSQSPTLDEFPDVDYADSSSSKENVTVEYFDWSDGTRTFMPDTSDQKVKPGQRSEKIKGKKFAQSVKFMLQTTATNIDDLDKTDSAVGKNKVEKKIKKIHGSILKLPPVPATWTFSCPQNRSAYFADVDNQCRVYYMCNSDRRERHRFVCPLGTRFNEKSSNCDWWDNVDCSHNWH